jgi:hypothetical protein
VRIKCVADPLLPDDVEEEAVGHLNKIGVIKSDNALA